MDDLLVKFAEFVSEFRRRRIFHVLAAYAAAAFVVGEVAALAQDAFPLPPVFLTLVVLVCVLGFPIAAVLAWAFEVTPEGVRRTAAFLPQEEGDPKGPTVHTAFAGLTLIGTLALGLGAWQLFLRPEPGAPETTASEAPHPTDVAVLYFDPIGPGEELDYFADGLTEGLIDELARVEALHVKSRTAVKPFRSGEATHDSIVRVLRVGNLVEGSVRRVGDSVQVTVQLIDAGTGDHLASAELVRSWQERLGLEREIGVVASDMIRRRLGVQIERRERSRSTESTEAWTLVQKAERARDDAAVLASRGDPAAAARRLAAADSALQEAERLDPSWVDPLLLRGWVAADHGHVTGTTPDSRDPDPYRRGIRLADRALELTPDHAGALELRGVLRFRLSRTRRVAGAETLRRAAEHDLRAALDTDAGLARAWAELSELYRLEDRNAEAKWAAEQALEADAFLSDAHEIFRRLYQVSLDLEDWEDSEKWCDRARERFPDSPVFVACSLFFLALTDGPSPDVDRAWDLYRQLDELSPRGATGRRNRAFGKLWVAGTIARAAAARASDSSRQNPLEGEDDPLPAAKGTGAAASPGDSPELLADSARAVVARTRREAPQSLEPWLDYYEANVLQHLEEPAAAVALLRRYVSALPEGRKELESDWMFRPLWQEPAFAELTESS